MRVTARLKNFLGFTFEASIFWHFKAAANESFPKSKIKFYRKPFEVKIVSFEVLSGMLVRSHHFQLFHRRKVLPTATQCNHFLLDMKILVLPTLAPIQFDY